MASPRWAASRERYALHLKAQGRRPGTLNIHNSAIRCWERYCCARHLNPLRAQEITCEGWLASLYGLYSQSTIRHYLLALRGFFCWQGDGAAISALPVPVEQPVAVRPFSRADLRRLLNAADSARDRSILLLLIGSGMRAAELVGIRIEDIEDGAGTILIHGKGGKSRLVAPGLTAMEALHEYVHAGHIRRGFVFPMLPSSLYHVIVRLGERTGVAGAYPHRFRHTFASMFLENGGGVGDLKIILGHSTITMSLRYARYYEADRALDAQRRLNPADALFKSLPRTVGEVSA